MPATKSARDIFIAALDSPSAHRAAYLDEACYRFDRRETDRTVRVDDLLTRVAGRITYGTLIADGQEKAAS